MLCRTMQERKSKIANRGQIVEMGIGGNLNGLRRKNDSMESIK